MEKINIAELLHDCPKGMELDCTMFENVTFEEVVTEIDCNGNEDIDIVLLTHYNDGMVDEIILTEFGTYTYDETAKCVIFPKGKTTWEGFVPPCQFKDGDILFVDCSDDEEDKNYQYIFILNNPKKYGKWHSYCYLDGFGCFEPKEKYLTDDVYQPRFATKEEKQKLFQAIKANSYRWNPKTKTLEKLPIFKVGDRIKHIVGREEIATVIGIENFHYNIDSKLGTTSFSISLQHEWELVPNKFDIADLKPFETVLVRNSNNGRRVGQFYLSYDFKEEYPFECTYNCWKYCIPYKGNEHLLNKTDKPDNFYITWKE